MLSFTLGKYIALEYQDHMVGVCLTFKEIAKLAFPVVILFHIPTNNVGKSQFLHNPAHSWQSVFLNLPIVTGVP